MLIRINGVEKNVDDGLTIEALLSSLGIGLAGTAVEVNREVVPKRLLNDTPVREGDSIEVIRMVGGG